MYPKRSVATACVGSADGELLAAGVVLPVIEAVGGAEGAVDVVAVLQAATTRDETTPRDSIGSRDLLMVHVILTIYHVILTIYTEK